jgi:hypothetical protein
LVSVKFCDLVCPSTMLPKLKLAGETLRPACAPVPLRFIVSGDPGASLVTFTVPVAFPGVVGANFTLSVAACPVFNMAGVVKPLTVNPVPAATTLEICTAALPELVNVILCAALLPVATVPKLRLVVLAVNLPAGAAVPVPVNPITSAGPLPLLAIVIVPVALPILAGANFTASVAVCDGFNVAGTATPLALNPVPAATTLEIFTAALPVFVNVTFCEALLPEATFPKPTFVGLALNCPSAAVVPFPVSVTLVVGVVGSLLVIAIPPVALPVAVGENVTDAEIDWPALTVRGVAIPLIPNSAPFTLISEITKSAVPPLLTTRFVVPLDPTDTVPKSIEVELRDTCGAAVAVTVPERFTTVGAVPASPCTLIVPLTVPAFVPLIQTVMFELWPAAIVAGSVIPDIPNCEFENVACSRVIAAFPVLVTITFCEVFCPAATFPKFTLCGETAKLADALCCWPLTRPAQPFRRSSGHRASTREMFRRERFFVLILVLDQHRTVTTRPLSIESASTAFVCRKSRGVAKFL